MDPCDLEKVRAWLDEEHFREPSPDEDLEAAVDWTRLKRTILAHLMTLMGNEAEVWRCIVDCGHPEFLPPASLPFDAASQRLLAYQTHLADDLALPQLRYFMGINGIVANNPQELEEYLRISETPDWARVPCSLSTLWDHADDLCYCTWLDAYLLRGLVRSGNYLKPGQTAQPSVALGL